MITAGAKVIILFGVSSNGSAPVVAVAKAAHVPVIAYDLFLTNVSDIAFATTRDDYAAGKIQAQAAVKAVPKGNYVLVKGDPTLDGEKFAAAYPPVLQPFTARGDIKIVSEQWNKLWSPQSALQQAEQALTANHNDIQAMLTTNDGMATGVIQALKEQHLQGKVFVSGLDADPVNVHYLALGWQTIDIWSSIDKEGRQTVKVADLLAQGKKIPRSMYNAVLNNGKIRVPTWYVPMKELTTKNLCSWLKHGAPPGWVSLKDVYKGLKQPC
jgi:D-xylose transport system substrate-binding protein